MNREQYQDLTRVCTQREPRVSGSDLNDQQDRTLLYGYTTDRNTHHVYLKDGTLHLLVYRYGTHEKIVLRHEAGELPMHSLVPNKRLYPEKCDHAFCSFLQDEGIYLPFTTFSDDWPEPGRPRLVGYIYDSKTGEVIEPIRG